MLGYFGTIQGRFRAGNTNSKKTFSLEVKLKDSEGASVFDCVYHTTDTKVSTKIPLVRQSSDLILPEKNIKSTVIFESFITDLSLMIIVILLDKGDLRGRFESLSVSA